MDIGEIISESIRYPTNDMDNIRYPLIVFGMLALPLLLLAIGVYMDVSSITGIFTIIFFIGLIAFILIAPGYLLSVTKEGINRSGTIPEIQPSRNIVDTIKLFIISFVYSLIPGIIITILMVILGSSVSSGGIDSATGLFAIVLIITIILEIIFGLFATIAILRFANTDSLSDAFSFSEVFEELKQAGILKLILLGIVLGIISAIILLVGSFISMIPIIGVFITFLAIYGFVALFESYAMGLFYSDVAE